MTDAERRLWRMLQQSFPEAHFRRQVPIRHYIADFASHRAKLIVEVDGRPHTLESDSLRTQALLEEGYLVLRFWNNEVLCNSDGVWAVIGRALHADHPHPNPPPSRGRENGAA